MHAAQPCRPGPWPLSAVNVRRCCAEYCHGVGWSVNNAYVMKPAQDGLAARIMRWVVYPGAVRSSDDLEPAPARTPPLRRASPDRYPGELWIRRGARFTKVARAGSIPRANRRADIPGRGARERAGQRSTTTSRASSVASALGPRRQQPGAAEEGGGTRGDRCSMEAACTRWRRDTESLHRQAATGVFTTMLCSASGDAGSVNRR